MMMRKKIRRDEKRKIMREIKKIREVFGKYELS